MTGIRADANDQIASGHIMRCMTIARALEEQGEQVVFFTADDYGGEMLRQEGFAYYCLNVSWEKKDEELEDFLTLLNRTGCHRLLVDSYQATDSYLIRLRQVLPVAYIDDMFERIFPVDLLINYNGYYTLFPYQKVYPSETRLLLGPSYVPLRKEFCRNKKENVKTEARVLLSCGGGDQFNMLTSVLRKAGEYEELSGVVFHTVVGRFNRNEEELRSLEMENKGIVLHFDVRNMAELMSRCDLAVSAAGTMLYELCAMKLPTIFFSCADNQQYDRDYYDREGIMIYAGDVRTEKEQCASRICRGLIRLIEEPELRARLREGAGGVTDGRGAERIAKELLLMNIRTDEPIQPGKL